MFVIKSRGVLINSISMKLSPDKDDIGMEKSKLQCIKKLKGEKPNAGSNND